MQLHSEPHRFPALSLEEGWRKPVPAWGAYLCVLHGPPLTISITGIFYVANASGVTHGWNGLMTVSAAQNSSGKADYPAAGDENNQLFSHSAETERGPETSCRIITHNAVN